MYNMQPETPNQPEASQQGNIKKQRPTIRFDNSDLIKSGFWVGQIFMVLATVVGVFLAAQEGLSQAIQFDNLNSKESNFYLQHALADEISDNTIILNKYAELLIKEAPYDIKAHHPLAGRFVWESMKYSSHALETPSKILSAIRRYNNETTILINKIENRQLGIRYGAGLLKELNEKVKAGALKDLIANYTKLHHELIEAGIEISPLASETP